MVTCKLRLSSAKGKERLLGRRGLVPGRSKLVKQRLHEGTEDASSASLVLQILWELDCKSHRLPETPVLLLMEAILLVPISPKSYLQGNDPGQPPLLVGHRRSGC